uniref:Uncharacterized protein n=1 Tax=Tanacetum cinerariifolium TaxID=118510 RepID=A0A6L2J940_TANCI|nr:hypothetical protein [Tanacetum cinerariifolium]
MCAYSFIIHHLASCLISILYTSCMVSYKDNLYKLLLVQEELTALRFRVDITEEDNASLRTSIKTKEAIKKITRNRERQARIKIEQQLAAVQESQHQDREDFRKLKELLTSQFGQ